MKATFRVFSQYLPLFLLSVASVSAPQICAQDWVHTGTNLGNERIRLAAADFKPVGSDPGTAPLKAVFDSTLYNDLASAGIFDMVSKSLAPQAMPGSPQEFVGDQWSVPRPARLWWPSSAFCHQRQAGRLRMADGRAHGGQHSGACQAIQRGG